MTSLLSAQHLPPAASASNGTRPLLPCAHFASPSSSLSSPLHPPCRPAMPLPAAAHAPLHKDRKAILVEELWQQFFSDPSQWRDDRFGKRNARAPDFKHKYSDKALWVDKKCNPPWVFVRLAAMARNKQGDQRPCFGRVIRTEQLWLDFFLDPSRWWDTRLIHKETLNSPDFKHKITHEGLWIEGRLNPSWVDGNIKTVASSQPQSLASYGISKLIQDGQLEEALYAVENMLEQNTKAPINTYVVLLKGFGKRKSLEGVKRLHALIIKSGLDSVTFLNNTLIDAYAKCGSVSNARHVFNSMSEHNVFSWSAFISACTEDGQAEEAVDLFQQMKQKGILPDKVTFVLVLKACAKIAALEQGKQIHLDIIKHGFESDRVVGNALVNMYAKGGNIDSAYQIFSKMRERDVVSWNSMISGYSQNGLGNRAFSLYEQMKQENVQPNNVTFYILAKACAKEAALEQGKQLHLDIVRSGYGRDVILGNALIDMYAKCGCIHHARETFYKLEKRDVVSWSSLIGGYTQNGLGTEALSLYELMKQNGVQPNSVTYVILLAACTRINALEQGKQLHLDIIKSRFESDVTISNALIDMYSKCGCISDAFGLFKNMKDRDVVSWSAMIAGYIQNGLVQEAFALYDQMKQESVQPNHVTYVVLLNACASIGALEQGKKLHTDIIKSKLDQDLSVGNTLIDLYVKCGCIENALEVFTAMIERDVVSWSSMIAGYVQNNREEEASALYDKMKQEAVEPNVVTYIILLKACASMLALEKGKQLHVDVIRSGFESDVNIGTTLVDMYAKCGCIEYASRVFNNMQNRDTVSWNVMISGYAQQGLGGEALKFMELMQSEDARPDEATYVCALSACSHCGLISEGRILFNGMLEQGIRPTMDHYSCMVDLLSRVGCLAEAADFIDKMPVRANVVIWRTLLGAARIHGNPEIGKQAFDSIIKLEPENNAAYVLLSDTLATAGSNS